jgi:5-formyltetrahydrofolate cyclo-ligase
MLDKHNIRKMLRVERSAYARNRPPIEPQAGFIKLLETAGCLAAYLPVGAEADPGALVTMARANGWTIAFPHVVSRAEPLRFLRYDPGDPLVLGPFALRQPEVNAPLATPTVILTPLIGFTRSGVRLGQGAGYYDRAFAALPHALRVGIAWSVQERVDLPEDPWDIRLHAILTEHEWIVTS